MPSRRPYKIMRFVVDVMSRTPPCKVEEEIRKALGLALTESNISVNCVSARTFDRKRKIPCCGCVFILNTPSPETLKGLEV